MSNERSYWINACMALICLVLLASSGWFRSASQDSSRPFRDIKEKIDRIVVDIYCCAQHHHHWIRYRMDRTIDAKTNPHIAEALNEMIHCVLEASTISTAGFSESQGTIRLFSGNREIISVETNDPHYLIHRRNGESKVLMYNAHTFEGILIAFGVRAPKEDQEYIINGLRK